MNSLGTNGLGASAEIPPTETYVLSTGYWERYSCTSQSIASSLVSNVGNSRCEKFLKFS
jgi:hypothetical protein